MYWDINTAGLPLSPVGLLDPLTRFFWAWYHERVLRRAVGLT